MTMQCIHNDLSVLSTLLAGREVLIDGIKNGIVSKVTLEARQEKHWDQLELYIGVHIKEGEGKGKATYLYPASRISLAGSPNE